MTLISEQQIADTKARYGIEQLERASIRQLVMMVSDLEALSGVDFVRMELGVPGLSPAPQARAAEHAVIDSPLLAQYPALNGNPSLRQALSQFFKSFMNVDVPADNCIPTAGAMQASLAAFWLVANLHPTRTKILFLDPGFPTQIQQVQSLGIAYERVDVFAQRPRRVADQIRPYLENGDIAGIVYSNPSNPVWNCLAPEELEEIAALCDAHETIALEDLAYFGMDFRVDYSQPNQPPYPPSMGHYTHRCIQMFSGSKLFNYAGQRTGAVVIPEALMAIESEQLKARFGYASLRNALLFGVIQPTTAGLCQSAQAGFEGALRAMLDGKWNPLIEARAYEQRAVKLKAALSAHGFELLYDADGDTPIADGFYFAFGHPAYPDAGLAQALIEFGVSATPLTDAGAHHKHGLRACVGLMTDDDLHRIVGRLAAFQEAHA
ncbi:aminotransferase class I/II-fold pyridoxal phosphate-dependent enzyme [Litorivicinus lipolyticus]|uniref:aminotransferase class I/II-fold pyridoxal phosphate-dependent enzyme n=1 Tax=Litorivicinus lipolyticus TaxID=418701 RepID=UPI003B58F2A2